MTKENQQTTTGITSIKEGNVIHQKITNPFIKMIKNALKEQLIILQKRKKSLKHGTMMRRIDLKKPLVLLMKKLDNGYYLA